MTKKETAKKAAKPSKVKKATSNIVKIDGEDKIQVTHPDGRVELISL